MTLPADRRYRGVQNVFTGGRTCGTWCGAFCARAARCFLSALLPPSPVGVTWVGARAERLYALLLPVHLLRQVVLAPHILPLF